MIFLKGYFWSFPMRYSYRTVNNSRDIIFEGQICIKTKEKHNEHFLQTILFLYLDTKGEVVLPVIPSGDRRNWK